MSEKVKRPWSPSVANAIETREVLIKLLGEAEKQWLVISSLQSALGALARSRDDDSMVAVCRSLGIEISSLYSILITADIRAKTGILVEEMDE